MVEDFIFYLREDVWGENHELQKQRFWTLIIIGHLIIGGGR